MKKTLLAAALLAGFAGAASAQSSVTLYGLIDVGVRYANVSYDADNLNASNFGVASGTSSANRFGLKGVEDIGGGNKVFFTLEQGFNTLDGKEGSSTKQFSRDVFLGLENKSWGSARLGRFANFSSSWIVAAFDPFGGSYAQMNMGNAFTSGNTVRMDNFLMYQSPVMNGFQVGAGYSFATGLSSNGGATSPGTEATGYNFESQNNTRALSLGAKYANGPILTALTYEKVYAADSSAQSGKSVNSWSLGGSYDFKVAKVAAAFGQTRDGFWIGSSNGGSGASLDRNILGNTNAVVFANAVGYNSYFVGATIPVNQVSNVLLSWTMIAPNTNMKDAYNAQNQNSFNLGYTYDFTKRTNLYAYVGQTQNYATVDTAKSTVVGLGLRHKF